MKRRRGILLKIVIVIAVSLSIISCSNNNKKIGGVHAAFYNSKGTVIAASTDIGNLLLLDTQLQVIKAVTTEQGNTTSSFFSLNDKQIITGGSNKTLCIWNSGTLKLEKEYKFNFYPYTSIYGYKTLGGCGEDGTFIMYNISQQDTFELTLENSGAYYLYYCFPDSIILVCSGKKSFQIDIVNKKILNEYTSHTDEVYCVMPSIDKNLVVSGSGDSTVRVFNRNSGELKFTSQKLDGKVYVCCFNADDSQIVASTSSGSIYLLDSKTNKIIKKVAAFKTIVNTIHYSPDGSRLVAASEGGGIKIFSTKTWEVLHQLETVHQ